MKHNIQIAGLLFGIAILGSILLVRMGKRYEKLSAPEKNIGRELILRGDTLMIYSYDLWNKTYTLSNGSRISIKLAEEKLENK